MAGLQLMYLASVLRTAMSAFEAGFRFQISNLRISPFPIWVSGCFNIVQHFAYIIGQHPDDSRFKPPG